MAQSTSQLIFFISEIVVYIFHLSLLILMIAGRKTIFKGSFFNIFRCVLAADVFYYIGLIFIQKISLIPPVANFLTSNPWNLSPIYCLLSFLTIIQFLGHLFLAFNRFTIIWFTLNYEGIWRRQWYTVVIFGIAFSIVIWRIPASAVLTVLSNGNGGISYTNPTVTEIMNVSLTIVYFSTTCFAAIFNILSFIKFFIRKKNNTVLNVNEKRLFFVSFAIFIAQLLRLSYNANRLLLPTNIQTAEFYTAAFPYLNDLFAWSGSISLMILSSSTRKAYLSFYFCKSDIQKIATNLTRQNMYPPTK